MDLCSSLPGVPELTVVDEDEDESRAVVLLGATFVVGVDFCFDFDGVVSFDFGFDGDLLTIDFFGADFDFRGETPVLSPLPPLCCTASTRINCTRTNPKENRENFMIFATDANESGIYNLVYRNLHKMK